MAGYRTRLVAALMALFVIKPMRRAFILGNEATADAKAHGVKAA